MNRTGQRTGSWFFRLNRPIRSDFQNTGHYDISFLAKKQENPQYEKFRNKGLHFNMADGKFTWAPSSEMLPSGIEEDGDGYRPYFEEGHVDIEEGFGDSDEVPGVSIGEVMAEIQKMEAITSDPDFHSRCCQLMMIKPTREKFVSLKGYEQRLLDWLKHAAYNPLPFMPN
ncbi:hypothetical protein PIB30_026477 [Stylosanthes scabra]|uniref:Uncharacterized protein n=1 Tax=Stylosanthes scabra TaxID=79078 RepID=A0ABU6XA12_9FABA|nr:hypothetical protein [Stylosanthes scabra]